ncbi:unnamed protein product [Malus baccata var. baccata]
MTILDNINKGKATIHTFNRASHKHNLLRIAELQHSHGRVSITIIVMGQQISYKQFNLDLDPKDNSIPKLNANDDAMHISLDLDRPKRKAMTESKLTDWENELFTNFLRANKDVFVWSTEDMQESTIR